MNDDDDISMSGESYESYSSVMDYESYDTESSTESNLSIPFIDIQNLIVELSSESEDDPVSPYDPNYQSSDDSQNISDTERSQQSLVTESSESGPSESGTSDSGTSESRPSELTSTQNTAKSEQSTLMIANENSEVSGKEAFSCPICLEGLTTSGAHRPACLKCGHIFGQCCLERWLKNGCNADARRCPTCNTRANVRDVRILYATNIVAVDTAEITALENKLDQEKISKKLLEKQITMWESKCEYLSTEVDRLNKLDKNQSPVPDVRFRECLTKINLTKLPGCRVLAYNEKNMMLVVSQSSENPLFKTHMIRKINTTLMKPQSDSIFVHKKPIRDMSFHPIEDSILASVGLDKLINLIDLKSNTVVSSLDVTEPLWSCCWAGNNTNLLMAGSQTGSLYYIDRRFMRLLNIDHKKNLPCVSLTSIAPSNSRSFPDGGFLKTKMNLLSIFEPRSQDVFSYKETELPLKGLWCSTCFDNESSLILASAKPCGTNKSARHIVSKIVNSTMGSAIHPVVTFYGGDKATQLSRSCFVPSNGCNKDTLVSYYDEKSSSIHLCSVNSSSTIEKFPVRENILDICSLNGLIVHKRRTIAALSENSVSIYCV